MSEYVANSFKYGDEEKDFDDIRPRPFLFDVSSEDAAKNFFMSRMLPGKFIDDEQVWNNSDKSYEYWND